LILILQSKIKINILYRLCQSSKTFAAFGGGVFFRGTFLLILLRKINKNVTLKKCSLAACAAKGYFF